MFVVIIIIILGACAIVVWSMYYNTIAMQKTYGSVNWYYWAYYWAMASVERWLLMSKLKYPTYVGSGWFKWDNIYWAQSNGFSWDFWKLTQWENSMIWEVNSKTSEITGMIDTKTLRIISFDKYSDANPNTFSTGRELLGASWITEWLTFSGTTCPYSANISNDGCIVINTETWKSSDFNRFFALKDTWYIVRWLNTTELYNKVEEEKDYQLTWYFNFTGWSKNPRPALSWLHIQ